MRINLKIVSSVIDEINNNLSNYEIASSEMLSTIKNMNYYWQDGYTLSFFKKVEEETQDTYDLIESIYNLLKDLKFLLLTYQSLSNRIISKFPNLDSQIINSNDFIITGLENEEEAENKKDINNSIFEIEEEISYSLSKINIPFIKAISFDSLDHSNENCNFLGMKDNIKNEIKKTEKLNDDSKKYSEYLIDELNNFTNNYNTKNLKKLKNIIDSISISIFQNKNNLNNTYNYIIRREKEYINLINNLVNEINQINI